MLCYLVQRKFHFPKSQKAKGTNGSLWCLLAHQSPCWPPGSLNIMSISPPPPLLYTFLAQGLPFSQLSNSPYNPATLAMCSPALSLSSSFPSLCSTFSLSLSSLSALFLLLWWPGLVSWPCSVYYCFVFLLWTHSDAIGCSSSHSCNTNLSLSYTMAWSCCQVIQCELTGCPGPLQIWKLVSYSPKSPPLQY